MNKKQVIRLNESQFHKIVKECVKHVLNERNPHLRDLEDDDDFEDYNDYKQAQRHNAVWDGEDEEIITDTHGMRVFTPSEEWETGNEENFMGGRSEDYDEMESFHEYVVDEIIDFSNTIVDECRKAIELINKGIEDEIGYDEGNHTSFIVSDYDNSGWVHIVCGNIEINVGSKKDFGYVIYTRKYNPSNSAYHSGGYTHSYDTSGSLSYNKFETDGKRLFITLVKSILEACIYQENYKQNISSFYDMFKKSPKAINAMKKAYSSVINVKRVLLKKYGRAQ